MRVFALAALGDRVDRASGRWVIVSAPACRWRILEYFLRRYSHEAVAEPIAPAIVSQWRPLITRDETVGELLALIEADCDFSRARFRPIDLSALARRFRPSASSMIALYRTHKLFSPLRWRFAAPLNKGSSKI